MGAYDDFDGDKASRKAWNKNTKERKAGQGDLMDGFMSRDALMRFAQATMGAGFVMHRFEVQVEREGNVCHVWLRLKSTQGQERSISFVHVGSRVAPALLEAYEIAERMFVNAKVEGL